jgi:hypothetical protein
VSPPEHFSNKNLKKMKETAFPMMYDENRYQVDTFPIQGGGL